MHFLQTRLSIRENHHSMSCFQRFFGEDGKSYAQFRPSYPPELYQRILEYHGGERELAVDVATGTGQASKHLSKIFERVVAVDSSPEQLAEVATLHSD